MVVSNLKKKKVRKKRDSVCKVSLCCAVNSL